jgi:hypothetical protein
MRVDWYEKVVHNHAHIMRTDFRITRRYRRKLLREHLLSQAMAEFFKTQRLHPDEIKELDDLRANGQPLGDTFAQKLRQAFAEGVLRDDLKTVDEDAFIGTCGQLIFKWIRTEYYGPEIICALPKLLTDSSKKQGIDYFEILGNPNDLSSLSFIVWEIKATDVDVASRTDEIYRMHKGRTARLLRGLELQLSQEYPTDKYPVVGTFVQRLLDHWNGNTASKHIGGSVIFDTSNNPGDVFTTFHTQFPDLYSPTCRQVLLIEIPRFRKMRKELWTHLQAQMS